WNCEAENGSVRSSFHTTIGVLEGLLEYERSGGAVPVAEARGRAEEYLLLRGLCRRASTGEVIDADWLTFSFPVHWYYDILRGLDYFYFRGGIPDPRLDEAVQCVRDCRQPDGTWWRPTAVVETTIIRPDLAYMPSSGHMTVTFTTATRPPVPAPGPDAAPRSGSSCHSGRAWYYIPMSAERKHQTAVIYARQSLD